MWDRIRIALKMRIEELYTVMAVPVLMYGSEN
jgi:hypothetical protein